MSLKEKEIKRIENLKGFNGWALTDDRRNIVKSFNNYDDMINVYAGGGFKDCYLSYIVDRSSGRVINGAPVWYLK